MEETSKSFGKKVLDYLITTLNGMAYGLFATLIIGTIIGTLGTLIGKTGDNTVVKFITEAFASTSTCLSCITGAGIGVGIALALKMTPLKSVVLAGVGEMAAYFSLTTKFVTAGTIANTFKIGDPLTVYLVCIGVALLMELVLRKKTPVDILIVPLFACLCGVILSLAIRYPAIYVTYGVQYVVDKVTLAQPFLMGVVVSVIMGMALTAPISSAAIGAMIFTGEMTAADGSLTGLAIASGAAIVGCCCQMLGFAVQSRKDNNIGMVISIGIGTSMLQFKNILKKPIVWLPTIITSAILGPVSTCFIKIVCMGSSAGMGTAGIVGQIGTIASMTSDAYTLGSWRIWVGILLLEIIAPAIITYVIDLLFRKANLIKDGDLKV